jgi:membrane associated rhomboid family serine protease
MVVLGGWALIQGLSLFDGDAGSIALWAHAGGFVAGLVLTPLLKRDHARLADHRSVD